MEPPKEGRQTFPVPVKGAVGDPSGFLIGKILAEMEDGDFPERNTNLSQGLATDVIIPLSQRPDLIEI